MKLKFTVPTKLITVPTVLLGFTIGEPTGHSRRQIPGYRRIKISTKLCLSTPTSYRYCSSSTVSSAVTS